MQVVVVGVLVLLYYIITYLPSPFVANSGDKSNAARTNKNLAIQQPTSTLDINCRCEKSLKNKIKQQHKKIINKSHSGNFYKVFN